MAFVMRLARATAVVEAEERFAGVTLEEVVSSHVSSAVEIAERAASFGSDLACRARYSRRLMHARCAT